MSEPRALPTPSRGAVGGRGNPTSGERRAVPGVRIQARLSLGIFTAPRTPPRGRGPGSAQFALLARLLGRDDGWDHGFGSAFSQPVTRLTTSWSWPRKPWCELASHGSPDPAEPPFMIFTSTWLAPVSSALNLLPEDAGV